jgi:hypothetical protein
MVYWARSVGVIWGGWFPMLVAEAFAGTVVSFLHRYRLSNKNREPRKVLLLIGGWFMKMVSILVNKMIKVRLFFRGPEDI